ncbi:MAG: pyridoxine 5'-phosphate synthase [PVC group bacterium]|nr:pyridoxine 5'-phosphate synthase [PVC group bacterium]
MVKLGVNIDHVATVRQARRTIEPDPVAAAVLVELAGGDGITVHLREDRRHINDRDVDILRQVVRTKLNLEMSIAPSIVKIACRIKPDQVTLVPEKRQEITTEGGLNVSGQLKKIKKTVKTLQKKGIVVSLFIAAEKKQIEAASKTGAEFIELHTGRYANMKSKKTADKELRVLAIGAVLAKSLGLRVNAGHGLTYLNTRELVETVPYLEELNIGHSIVSKAVLVGMENAVLEMKELINSCQQGDN